jgi:DNA-directed RNA polymerase I, II, and III subunit RPABC2
MDEEDCISQVSEVSDNEEIQEITYDPDDLSDVDVKEEDYEEDEVNQGDNDFSRFNIVGKEDTYNDYFSKTKKTRPYITKFEKTQILGIRASQIENGAIPLVEVPKDVHQSKEIAELEYQQQTIPLLVRRFLPDESYEDWRLTDFHNL